MSRFPVIVGPRLPCVSALAIARDSGEHFLLVVDGSRLAGVARVCDLRHWAADDEVQHSLRGPVITIAESEPVSLAWQLLTMTGSGCLVVIDGAGALRGVVTCEELGRAGHLSRRADSERCERCGTAQHLVFRQPDDPVMCCVCVARGQGTLTSA